MYRSEKPINWVSVRIALVAVIFAIGTVFLTVRAFMLQVSDPEDLRKRAERQRTRVIHLDARRGMILDRSGEQLAASLEVDSVYARPRKITDKTEAVRKLAEILEADEKEISQRLDEDKAFVWLKRRVSPLTAERIKKAGLPGIMTVTEYQRFYPLKAFAGHAIGFAGMDSKGLEGLELFYDDDLKVEPVPVTAQRDALGRPIMFTALVPDLKRRDVHLTLDRNIQHVTEQALDEAVQAERAKSGVALVMDADSGEILALAVRPGYNLNVFQKTAPDVLRNRAVADTFEPGSTFKVFLAAAALELGAVETGEKFNCHNGVFQYNGAEIHDVTPHKSLSFEEIIIHSSNIGAVKVSEKIKKTDYYRVLQGFGFGAATDVDLPGERPGVLPIPGRWSVLTKANLSFGQGVSLNALQLTAAFAAAINGGNLYRPHIMSKVTNTLGETIRENPPVLVRKVLKPSTSQAVADILRDAVRLGTGKQAAITGADVLGKTGTAQKADPAGGYSKDKHVASFIGALMGTKPRMVIFVMLDEPAGKIRTGGKIAAPVFRKIGEGILSLCGSKPSTPDLILASSAILPSRTGGTRNYTVSVRKGGKPGEWIVPDFKGLDMRQVLEACGKMKCDADFKGTGRAVNQEPRAGTVFREGAPLTVTFDGEPS